MQVRVRISSVLLGENTFNQMTMVGQNVVVQDNHIVTVREETATVSIDPESSTGYMEVAVFTELEPGDARFWIEASDNYHWRSGPVTLAGNDQLLSYGLFPVDKSGTTFSESFLEDAIELPMVQSMDNETNAGEPHEIISAITELKINIKSDHLRFNGKGYYGRRDIFEGAGGINIGSSDYDFTYKLRILPGNPIHHPGQMLRAEAVEPIEIFFANPVVGFVAFFMQQKINEDARQSIEKQLNAQVQDEIDARVTQQSSNPALLARVTATVIETKIIFDPQEEDFLEFNILMSFPSELTSASGNGNSGSGCGLKMLALLVLFVFAGAGLFCWLV
ncbi:MAG: hypothetical protein H6574_06415 [Lewinellaceae bacterium]|nr:hypothetical protein [Lewinellaceae bacterium]